MEEQKTLREIINEIEGKTFMGKPVKVSEIHCYWKSCNNGIKDISVNLFDTYLEVDIHICVKESKEYIEAEVYCYEN